MMNIGLPKVQVKVGAVYKVPYDSPKSKFSTRSITKSKMMKTSFLGQGHSNSQTFKGTIKGSADFEKEVSEVQPLRDYFKVESHWTPVFSSTDNGDKPNTLLFLVGDVLAYDTKSRRLRKVGCLDGIYKDLKESSKSFTPIGFRTPYQKLLIQERLGLHKDLIREKPYYDKNASEQQEKLKTIVGLHSEIGHFSGIESVIDSNKRSLLPQHRPKKQYYEVNELNRCHVYLQSSEFPENPTIITTTTTKDSNESVREKIPLSKFPQVKRGEVLVVVTGACYHEGTTILEDEDLSVSASITASASTKGLLHKRTSEDELEGKTTRKIFPSFIELKKLEQAKTPVRAEEDKKRNKFLSLFGLGPIANNRASNSSSSSSSSPTKKQTIVQNKSKQQTAAPIQVESETESISTNISQADNNIKKTEHMQKNNLLSLFKSLEEEKNTDSSRDSLQLHISLAFLANAVMVWSNSLLDSETQSESENESENETEIEIENSLTVDKILKHDRMLLPKNLRLLHSGITEYTTSDVLETYKYYFIDNNNKRDALLFKWEWKYNFSQGQKSVLPEELKQVYFRPSALSLEQVSTLEHATYYSKHTPIEGLVKQLVNVQKLTIFNNEEASSVFRLVAMLSCSSPQVVDKYNAKIANEIVMIFAKARVDGQQVFEKVMNQVTGELEKAEKAEDFTLAYMLELSEKFYNSLESSKATSSSSSNKPSFNSLGEIFVFALATSTSVSTKVLALNVIKLWETKQFSENESTLLFQVILPWSQSQQEKNLIQNKTATAKVNSAIQQLLSKAFAYKQKQISLDTEMSLVSKLKETNEQVLNYNDLCNLFI